MATKKSGTRRVELADTPKRAARPGKSRKSIVMMFGMVLVALVAVLFVASSNGRGDKPVADLVNGQAVESSNPLEGKQLYVDPQSNAARQAIEWRTSRPDDAKAMDRLASLPGSRWLGERITGLEVQEYALAAKQAGKVPVFVTYNIPNRDCGKYSAGGAKDAAAYQEFIGKVRGGIGDAPAVVILEPDALVQLDAKRDNGQPCLNDSEKETYLQLLKYAVEYLKTLPDVTVYIDAGNSGWMPDATAMADKLTKAGVAKADGFSMNISNFRSTEETVTYGTEIAYKLGDKHFVVDTSRNGSGHYDNPYDAAYNWCNPPGRSLGHYPTTDTGKELVDAYLYIKNVGESDGMDANQRRCFGGPKAGQWWPEYALGLVQRWPAALQPPSAGN